MEDIKSSWEIAREKADALGGLSVKEQRKQREDRCQPIGKSLADKFLAGQNIRETEKELLKYHDEERHCIKHIAIRYLIDAVKLENISIPDRAISCILSLGQRSEAEKIAIQIKEIFLEYRNVEEIERNKIETIGREMLHQQRISGSAIGMINIRSREEWRSKLIELAQPFEERLNALKKGLSECYSLP